MAVEAKDIFFLFAANRAVADAGAEGGIPDKSAKVTFEDVAVTGTVSVVAEVAGDTSLSLSIVGRDSTGSLITEAVSTHATTPDTTKVVSSASFERLIQVTFAAGAHAGALAVMCDGTSIGSGAAVGGGVDYIDINSGDNQADDYYKGWVIRIPTATNNQYELREVIKYTSSNDRIYVRDWTGGVAVSGDTYELSPGFVLEESAQTGALATDIDFVGRPFYNLAADPDNAVVRYAKIFAYNSHATLALSNATVTEDTTADATLRSKIGFDLETSLDGSEQVADRTTDPTGYTYDNGPNDVANSKNFSPDSGQGIWMELSLSAGDAAVNAEYGLEINGQSV